MENDLHEFHGVIVGFAGRLNHAKAAAENRAAAAEAMVQEWKQGDLWPLSDDQQEFVTVYVLDTDGVVKPCRVLVWVRIHAQCYDAPGDVPEAISSMLCQPSAASLSGGK